MNSFEPFAADLPADHSLHFGDVEECEDTLSRLGINQRLVQTGPGRFRASMAGRQSAYGELFSDRYSTGLSVSLEAPPGTTIVLVPRRTCGSFIIDGRPLEGRDIVILPPGHQLDIVVSHMAGSDSVIVPVEVLSSLVDKLSFPGDSLSDCDRIFSDESGFGHLGDLIAHQLNTEPTAPCPEEGLSWALAEAITGASRTSTDGRDALLPNRNATVARKARDYVHDRFRQPFRAEDLCRHVRVTLRRLQRSFKSQYGMSVSAYLGAVRLDAARRELTRAESTDTSVAEIALQCGFSHLGRFSVQYRSCFGESPRDTLDRPQRYA